MVMNKSIHTSWASFGRVGDRDQTNCWVDDFSGGVPGLGREKKNIKMPHPQRNDSRVN